MSTLKFCCPVRDGKHWSTFEPNRGNNFQISKYTALNKMVVNYTFKTNIVVIIWFQAKHLLRN